MVNNNKFEQEDISFEIKQLRSKIQNLESEATDLELQEKQLETLKQYPKIKKLKGKVFYKGFEAYETYLIITEIHDPKEVYSDRIIIGAIVELHYVDSFVPFRLFKSTRYTYEEITTYWRGKSTLDELKNKIKEKFNFSVGLNIFKSNDF